MNKMELVKLCNEALGGLTAGLYDHEVDVNTSWDETKKELTQTDICALRYVGMTFNWDFMIKLSDNMNSIQDNELYLNDFEGITSYNTLEDGTDIKFNIKSIYMTVENHVLANCYTECENDDFDDVALTLRIQ